MAVELASVAAAARRVGENVERVIVGKSEATTLLLVALLCDGHVLLEDVPGVGKTTLAKALARSLDLSFQRIQVTPDLLPSDVTGLSFFNQKTQEFQYRAGPLFANLVLADEINRATPRTQSALLEAMEERQVTADGETRALPRPFVVLATENPIELEGTFPLPEAQLDRFLLRLQLGYPDRAEERQIARRFLQSSPLDDLAPVLAADALPALARACRSVYVSDAIEEYIVDLVRVTREDDSVALGASPRATLALFRSSQALAAIDGRTFVLPDDVKRLAGPVLTHRLTLAPRARLDGRAASDVVTAILQKVPAPVEDVVGS
ncbi:MAG TPA: AAA family ATPase [Chloroflexota bacterium]|nr:AAA family ATPase [Chloroflexota bacterium]